jgi:putative transposase
MSIGGYKIRNKEAIHFVTFAVVEWVDVFTRKEYRDLLLDSIRHCQENRDLLVHAWCLMSNHLHWLISAKNHDPSEILRDFKKYTSKKIITAIENNQFESRRDWMLRIFKEHGEKNSRNSNYQFWRQDNQPKECYSSAFILQKLNYIHNNPVVAGIVDRPEDYLYSSARDYHFGKRVGLLHVDYL